jgi:hypothetical protein
VGDTIAHGSTTSEAPGDISPATTTATSTTEAPLTASFRGVTQDTIHLGLVDINWGKFQLAVYGFVEDVNARGGINRRLVEERFSDRRVPPTVVSPSSIRRFWWAEHQHPMTAPPSCRG